MHLRMELSGANIPAISVNGRICVNAETPVHRAGGLFLPDCHEHASEHGSGQVGAEHDGGVRQVATPQHR
jgi:hypothetical protein